MEDGVVVATEEEDSVDVVELIVLVVVVVGDMDEDEVEDLDEVVSLDVFVALGEVVVAEEVDSVDVEIVEDDSLEVEVDEVVEELCVDDSERLEGVEVDADVDELVLEADREVADKETCYTLSRIAQRLCRKSRCMEITDTQATTIVQDQRGTNLQLEGGTVVVLELDLVVDGLVVVLDGGGVVVVVDDGGRVVVVVELGGLVVVVEEGGSVVVVVVGGSVVVVVDDGGNVVVVELSVVDVVEFDVVVVRSSISDDIIAEVTFYYNYIQRR